MLSKYLLSKEDKIIVILVISIYYFSLNNLSLFNININLKIILTKTINNTNSIRESLLRIVINRRSTKIIKKTLIFRC